MLNNIKNATVVAFFVFPLLIQGCGSKTDKATPQNRSSVLVDQPLEHFRAELLDIAFETATAIPVEPHIKDRSRSQEAVAYAALELDQPRRALGHIEKIGNWRRGMGYGELALYCINHGYEDEAGRYLQLAEEVAVVAADWRRDRIRIKIAQAHALLGEMKKAEEFAANVDDAETGKLDQAKAMLVDEASFNKQAEVLDQLIATGQFDTIKNALDAYASIFDRMYGDPERRAIVEEKIKQSWEKLPVFLRIELVMELAESALAHTDQVEALALVDEAKAMKESATWPLEYEVPLMARLANLRFRAGDAERARSETDAALELFNGREEEIINIYRAETLYPLAETYQLMADTGTALMVYKQAVEAGVENPNARPRAEDLSATCTSMALHGVTPDPALWTRIREIKEGLRDPW